MWPKIEDMFKGERIKLAFNKFADKKIFYHCFEILTSFLCFHNNPQYNQ